MTIILTYAWWWVPTAITLLLIVWAIIPTDKDPIRALGELIVGLVTALVFWIVAGFMK